MNKRVLYVLYTHTNIYIYIYIIRALGRHFCWGSGAPTIWISKGPRQNLKGPSIEIYFQFSNFWGSIGPSGKISQGPHWIFRGPGPLPPGPREPCIYIYILGIGTWAFKNEFNTVLILRCLLVTYSQTKLVLFDMQLTSFDRWNGMRILENCLVFFYDIWA